MTAIRGTTTAGGGSAGTSYARSLDISATSDVYRSHDIHSADRTWPETNCYLDLCVEVVHALGHDPVPMLGSALAADHDGQQWTFVKPDPEDIRSLYGIQIAEENVWRPVLDTIETGSARDMYFTVEVDSWWLPDTAGNDYHCGHAKTSILPVHVDRDAQVLEYIHGRGLHRLVGDDFVGVFNLGGASEWLLPPFVEQVTQVGAPANPDDGLAVRLARKHLDRAPDHNPVERLGYTVSEAISWLPEVGVDTFHAWAFATLRQCGATAEIAADLAAYLDTHGAPGAQAACASFLEVASGAKSVQFKMARAARGRAVVVDDIMDHLAQQWNRAIDILDDALPQ